MSAAIEKRKADNKEALKIELLTPKELQLIDLYRATPDHRKDDIADYADTIIQAEKNRAAARRIYFYRRSTETKGVTTT